MPRQVSRLPSPPSPRLGFAAALSLLALTACRNDGSSNEADGTEGGTDTSPDTDDPSGPTGTDSADTTADDTGTGGGVEIEPVPGGMRRMVRREYVATIDMLLGPDAAEVADPPIDTPQDGFDAVGASLLALDAVAVEEYETSASLIADVVVADPSHLAEIVPCVMQSPDTACYGDIARDFGRLAFRRPLTDEEIASITAVGEHGQDWGEGDFNAGLRYQLMALLQMPSFLYLVEVGQPDEESGYRKLDEYELATRMSIFLLGRGPDAAMLDLAEQGGLESNAQIRDQAEAMVASTQARTALTGFFDEYLRLADLEATAKSPEIFPLFSAELARSMRQETLLLVHDIVWEQDGDYRELFTADYTFVDDRLAELYGMTPPAQAGIYERVDWPADQSRAGYLSQASFLTHQAGSLRNSPTKRGRFVQQSVLCTDIPKPPADVDPTLPPLPDNLTLRELLLMHMDDPSCATCHAATDPIGFAFENFDAIGAYRTTEPNGLPVSSQGEIEDFGAWNNPQELAALVAADPRTSLCVVNNLIRGELGHRETAGESDAIAELDLAFAEASYSMQSLLIEFPTSPLFQLVDEPK
jgi:hypothetical protein